MLVKIHIEEKDTDIVKEFALNATIIPVNTLGFNKEVVTFQGGSHIITSIDFDTLYKYDLAREYDPKEGLYDRLLKIETHYDSLDDGSRLATELTRVGVYINDYVIINSAGDIIISPFNGK